MANRFKLRISLRREWAAIALIALLPALAVAVDAGKSVDFKHHNNTELASVLQHVHNKCPDITRLYTLSETSVNGIPLYGLEITDNPGKHELSKMTLLMHFEAL